MPEQNETASASSPNSKKTTKPAKASRTIKAKKTTTPSKKASRATKKKVAKQAGEHPHTNVPRTGDMAIVSPGDTPSGVGLEGFRGGAAPLAGSAEAMPTAKGGPPHQSPKKAQARRQKVTGHV